MYLFLLQKQKPEQAKTFFNKFSNCLSSYDFANLFSIQTKNDLYSEFAKKLYFHRPDDLDTKYIISVRKSSLLLFMSFIEENKLFSLIFIINLHIDVHLSLESSNDIPVLISDMENYKNKSYLALNVAIEEDKRREIKVPLPIINQDYMAKRILEIDQKIDLANKLPYIVCHNVKTFNKESTSCTCIEISEDGCFIIAGFEDSLIRI